MKRTFTCIVCPNGCEIEAEYEGTQVLSVTGNLCPKGKSYVTQELVGPGTEWHTAADQRPADESGSQGPCL